LEDTLAALADNRPVQVGYSTRFLILWPEHLNGGEVQVEFAGTMTLVPLLSTD
jgi:hypothetical protein